MNQQATIDTDQPTADWNNRHTNDASGWVNELLTLIDKPHHENWRDAVRTIAYGLHRAIRATPSAQQEPPAGMVPALKEALAVFDQLRQAATFTVLADSMTDAKNGIRMLNSYDQPAKEHIKKLRAMIAAAPPSPVQGGKEAV